MKTKQRGRSTRLTAILLAVMLLIPMMAYPVFANAAENTTDFAGGKGTAESPYLISTAAHLNNVRNYMSAYFKMTNDIQFSDSHFEERGAYYNDGIGWYPFEGEFTGHFNGNGFAIRNIQFAIAYEGTAFSGLFEINSGIISNLTLEAYFLIEGAASGESVVSALGGITGYNTESGLIVNCNSEGYISVYGDNTVVAGGIAGINEGKLRNCCNTADVEAMSYNFHSSAGGVAGISYSAIDYCANKGFITSFGYYAASDANTGGVVGVLSGGNINYSYNTGSVYSNYVGGDVLCFGLAMSGGIVGAADSGRIYGCYNTGTVRGESKESGCISGGIAGVAQCTIESCYNSGGITNQAGYSKNLISGGIVGMGLGDITNIYNIGTVSGAYMVGGLAGAIAGGNICYGYNMGGVGVIIDGTKSYLGAILGYREGGSIYNLYYLNTTAAGSNAAGDGTTGSGLYPLSWDQMKHQANFSRIDFTSCWTMNGMNGFVNPMLTATMKAKITTGISVVSRPNKTSYEMGESLDIEGLEVKLNYEDGSSKSLGGYVLSGFDSTTEGKKTVYLEYDHFVTSFEVEVASPVLTGIRIGNSPTRVNYPVGTELNTEGLKVYGIYGGSTEKVVNGYTVTGYDADTLGIQTLTVSYDGFTAQFDVTVFDPETNMIKGDADCDLEVDSDDAVYLLYNVLFGDGNYVLHQVCDFDGNGVKESDDAIYLLYHVLFGSVDYPLN